MGLFPQNSRRQSPRRTKRCATRWFPSATIAGASIGILMLLGATAPSSSAQQSTLQTLHRSLRGNSSFERLLPTGAAVCGLLAGGSSTDPALDAGDLVANVSFIVNHHQDAPCCGGAVGLADAVQSCLSIAMGAVLSQEDSACDKLCQQAGAFFEAMSRMNTLQIATIIFGFAATFMWLAGTAAFFFNDLESEGFFVRCGFFLWILFCCGTILCQCIELGIVYTSNAVETAETIKTAQCYNEEGDRGYTEVVSNLRSSGVVLWGELAVSFMALVVGFYTMHELFIRKDARLPPMVLETVLLLIEDGIAVGALVLLLQASSTAVAKANDSVCLTTNTSHPSDVVSSCVSLLPPGASAVVLKSQYLQKCGRDTPHVYLNLELEGVMAAKIEGTFAENLRQGVADAAGVGADSVSIDLMADKAGTGSARRAQYASSLVWLVVDTSTPGEATQVAHQFETAAYGDRLLSSLTASGVQVVSAKLRDINVKVPGTRECAPGQFVVEGASTCTICEADHFCAGADFFKVKCANSNSPVGSRTRADCVCTTGFGGENGVCLDCSRLACDPGNYTVGCGGTSAGTCEKCGACEAGSFREGCSRNIEGTCKACPANTYAVGSGFRTWCLPCESACPSGQYAVGCGGASRGTCVACDTSCAQGQYLAGACPTFEMV